MGGLGLRSARDHSTAAYISSVLATEHLMDDIKEGTNLDLVTNLTDAIAHLGEELGDQTTREELSCIPQKTISLNIDLKKLSLLQSDLETDREKARL